MGAIRFGPARLPSRESPEEAVRLLVERGARLDLKDEDGKTALDWNKRPEVAELLKRRDR